MNSVKRRENKIINTGKALPSKKSTCIRWQTEERWEFARDEGDGQVVRGTTKITVLGKKGQMLHTASLRGKREKGERYFGMGKRTTIQNSC